MQEESHVTSNDEKEYKISHNEYMFLMEICMRARMGLQMVWIDKDDLTIKDYYRRMEERDSVLRYIAGGILFGSSIVIAMSMGWLLAHSIKS